MAYLFGWPVHSKYATRFKFYDTVYFWWITSSYYLPRHQNVSAFNNVWWCCCNCAEDMRRVMVTMVMMTLLMTTVMTATEEFNATAVIQWIIDTWSDSRCTIDYFINFVPLDSYFKQVLFFSPVLLWSPMLFHRLIDYHQYCRQSSSCSFCHTVISNKVFGNLWPHVPEYTRLE